MGRILLALAILFLAAWKAQGKGDLYLLQVWNTAGKEEKQRKEKGSHTHWLRTHFRRNSKGLFARTHIKVLSGDKATRDGILAGLAWMKSRMKEDDTGIFTITCHGSGRKKGWGGAVHRPAGAPKAPFTSNHLIEAVSGFKGRLFVSVGSCHAGGILEEDGVKDLRNVVILCACRKDEGSSGALVPFAREGWSGAADKNRNGVIDSREIVEYMAKHHPPKFTPVFYHPKGLTPFPLMKVEKTRAATLPGRKTVRGGGRV